jgi:hypothetical protein
MDADERDICNFLKSWPNQFVSGREICRRAGGKRRVQQEPNWAIPVLVRLVEKALVEDDSQGHYRLIPKKPRQKKWVSPQIRKLLQQSGKDFGEVTEIHDQDD